jgi:hypothetical protein
MFDNSYKYVVYAIRYDKDMKIISMHTKRNQRIIVTKYNYDRLKVDKLYSKKEAKLK